MSPRAKRIALLLRLSACAGAFRWTDDGLVAFGPFEAQELATLYFHSTRAERSVTAARYEPEGDWAELFTPTALEQELLGSPLPYFLLEGHTDGTFSGTWLGNNEASNLVNQWTAKAR